MKKIALLLITIVMASSALLAENLKLSNEYFSTSVKFSDDCITGVDFNFRGDEVTVSDGQDPVFEIAVNGKVYTSRDKVWRYCGETAVTLTNNGTIHTYKFKGKGPLSGLTVLWDREIFPDAAFVRERLRLKSAKGKDLALTDVEGRNHLIFPAYTFQAGHPVQAKELRLARFESKRELTSNHMYHPDSVVFQAGATPAEVKGPFLITTCGDMTLVTSYEHASQDCAEEAVKGIKVKLGNNDGSQGVEGVLESLTDDDLWFIGTGISCAGEVLHIDNHIRHGGYLDGELIPSDGYYETVWSTISLLDSSKNPYEDIGEYLYSRITDNKAARESDFYYNTWGMQRDMPSKELYTIMTEDRLLKEIDLAAELGVQTFVLDDGWHETFGHWVANPERLPNGFAPLLERMRSYGIRPGIWLSAYGAGKETARTLEHPEWLVRDNEDNPIKGQWSNPVYDIVGPFYDALLKDLKDLTDEGFRFFKWDALNTANSTLSGLYHGDERYSPRERMDRYNYLFPIYVTRLMRELREYCPDVVVEIDLTEAQRALMGLITLQEGKLFFINNGASGYKDYTPYRSRSVRSVINEYADIIPQEIFTYAAYPHGSTIYNATTMIQAGHGFWGNLEKTTPEGRVAARFLVDNAKRVLAQVEGRLVERTGRMDESPEIYLQRNPDTGYALLTAFAHEPYTFDYMIPLAGENVLGVINHPYSADAEGVSLHLDFDEPDDCASAFVIGNDGSGVRVLSATGALSELELKDAALHVKAIEDATVAVLIPGKEVMTVDLKAGESRDFAIEATKSGDVARAPKDVYLDLMQIAVEAYTPQHVREYIADVDEDGIKEHGFARLTSNIGILIAHGRKMDYLDKFIRMMDLCAREIPTARVRNSSKGEIGNDFAVKELMLCLMEVEKAGVVPQEKIDGWKDTFRGMKAEDIYSSQPPVGDKTARNWSVFGAASECARLWAGVGGDRAYADKYLLDQSRFFDENGMYKDPHQPMVYDAVTRLQYMAALSFGYDGPAKAVIEENLLKSAMPTLAMQSVTGELPYGGRSNEFLHNETFLAAVCEYYAVWMKERGDMEAAARFKAAAARAVQSLEYWTSQKPLRHIKNRFPTETGYGCEKYAHFNKYMVTMGSWAYMAYRFADDSIVPAAGEEKPSFYVTSDPFHRIMMNGWGYTVQFDVDAQTDYDSSGVGRIQKAGAPPVIALSAPCPAVPNPSFKLDVKNEGPLAIAPDWEKYELVSAEAGKTVLTDGNAVWTCRIGRKGVRMTLKGEGEQMLTIPALVFDGEKSPQVECSDDCLEISFNGWKCTWKTNGRISDTGKIYGSRNGHLRRYEARSNGCLKVSVSIEKDK